MNRVRILRSHIHRRNFNWSWWRCWLCRRCGLLSFLRSLLEPCCERALLESLRGRLVELLCLNVISLHAHCHLVITVPLERRQEVSRRRFGALTSHRGIGCSRVG